MLKNYQSPITTHDESPKEIRNKRKTFTHMKGYINKYIQLGKTQSILSQSYNEIWVYTLHIFSKYNAQIFK